MKNTLTDLPFLFRPFHACLMLHVVTVLCHFYNLGAKLHAKLCSFGSAVCSPWLSL